MPLRDLILGPSRARRICDVAAAVKAVNATLPNPRPLPALVGGGGGPPPLDHVRANFSDLEDRFMSSPGGKFYFALAEKYIDEIRTLINENKKMADPSGTEIMDH